MPQNASELLQFVESMFYGLHEYMRFNVPATMKDEASALYNAVFSSAVLISYILLFYGILRAVFYIFTIAYRMAGDK